MGEIRVMERIAHIRGVLVDAVWPAQTLGRLRDFVLLLGGSLLIALSAQIEVPLTPVPITGQTFAVLLLAALYGSKRGAATCALYLLLGLTGLPVFAGGGAGLARFAGPTAGYLISYVPVAFVVGWLSERGWDRRVWSTALAMIIGNALIYLMGVIWLQRFVPAGTALEAGVYPFLVGDMIKIALATILLPTAWRFVGRGTNSGTAA
jgi:biotin transport system substrate-specific component